MTSLLAKPLSKLGNRVWKVTAEPNIEPVSVEELKLFAVIETDELDALLMGFIRAARAAAEEYMGRALIQQTIQMKMDFWPAEVVELPKPPLISVTKIATLDEDDVETEYASSNYYGVTAAIPGKIVLRQSATPPYNTSRNIGGYLVEYKAGYGVDAKDVPHPIREAIKLWAATVYETRVLDVKNPCPKAREQLELFRTVSVTVR
jgi:uncharacterized phiE125 gp8 family phage protein